MLLRCMGVLLLLSTTAFASEPQTERAATLFADGKRAFDEEHYQAAYDAFHAAYALTPAPALLYDMAAAQEALGRPGDAATSLRAYLRVVKEEPNRGALDARVRALDEAQRMIEVEQLRAQRPRLLELRAVEARSTRRGLAIGLGVGGAVIAVGLGIGLGIGLGVQPHYPSSTLGTQRVTP
jgi:hypothetical protein